MGWFAFKKNLNQIFICELFGLFFRKIVKNVIGKFLFFETVYKLVVVVANILGRFAIFRSDLNL